MKTEHKKICVDDTQVERLLTDATRIAHGETGDDICPTVRDMVDEYVPENIRKGKKRERKGKKREKTLEQKIENSILGKVKAKLWSKFDEIF